MKCNEHIRVLL